MQKGEAFTSAPPPAWDVRTLPSPQVASGVVPPSLSTSLASHPAQIVAVQPSPANLCEEVANKSAEINVLRSRLKQLEAENLKIKNEVVMAKDKGAQSETARQMRGDVERLQNELRYAKQDLISSEEERKRLKTSSEEAIAELKSIKSQKVTSQVANQSAPLASTLVSQRAVLNVPIGHQLTTGISTQPSAIAAATTALPTQLKTMPPPSASPIPTTASATSQLSWSPPHAQSSVQSPHPALTKAIGRQWRQDILLRELAAWEATSKGRICHPANAESSSVWFALHDVSTRLANTQKLSQQSSHLVRGADDDIAGMIVSQLQAARKGSHWVAIKSGARFVQVLLGLFPHLISMVRTKPAGVDGTSAGMSLCKELTDVLHDAVLGPQSDDNVCDSMQEGNEDASCHSCISQVLDTLVEVASKLRPHELPVFSNAFCRPSLCALLSETPRSSSLHIPCMSLLQVLLSSSDLYAVAHGTDSRENPLLAVANLLVVPAVESEEDDAEHISALQQCRIAALEVFCRCLASAPRLDIVLQLRGAPTSDGGMVDTVLQRIVFLCHHDLLCLGIQCVDGGPWHEQSMKDSGKARQRCVELSLMILSSFVWHAAPWTPEAHTSNHAAVTAACIDACTLLGRMRPLISSIVDMVVRRAADSSYYTSLLGRTSALRILLAHVDGEHTCLVHGASAVGLGGDRTGSAMVPMSVD